MLKWKFILLFLLLSGITISCAFGEILNRPADLQQENAPSTVTMLIPSEVSSSPVRATDLPVLTANPEIIESIPSAASVSDLRVAYFKDGNIWLWSQENGNKQLTNTGMDYSLKFSPDGQMIALTRKSGEYYVELWVINSDGTDERQVVSVQDFSDLAYEVRDPNAISVNPFQYAWIPGTHIIAFNLNQVYQGPGLALLDDLRLVNIDSNELSTLLLPGHGGGFVYSPDGKQIAISTPTTISLMNSDGTNRREVLVYDPVITYSEYRYYAKPTWSPDSSFIYVAIPPVDPLAEPVQPTSIWNMQADSSSATLLGSVKSTPFFVAEVEFSPDLSRIAYLSQVGEPAQNLGELHISGPDGSEDKVYISANFLNFAAWGTDSKKFNFTTDNKKRTQLGEIGMSPNPFTNNPFGIHNIQWIDEQYFIFLREKDAVFNLYLGNLNGGSALLDSFIDPSRQLAFVH